MLVSLWDPVPKAHLWAKVVEGLGSSSAGGGFCLSRGGNVFSLSLGNKVGGSLVAWPCHSLGLLAGFKTFPAAFFPPTPLGGKQRQPCSRSHRAALFSAH